MTRKTPGKRRGRVFERDDNCDETKSCSGTGDVSGKEGDGASDAATSTSAAASDHSDTVRPNTSCSSDTTHATVITSAKITLTVHTGVRQLRAGSADPMVSLDIHSIGVFDKDRNPSYTSQLLQFFNQKLGLPENRVVVIYHDLQPHNLGQKLS